MSNCTRVWFAFRALLLLSGPLVARADDFVTPELIPPPAFSDSEYDFLGRQKKEDTGKKPKRALDRLLDRLAYTPEIPEVSSKDTTLKADVVWHLARRREIAKAAAVHREFLLLLAADHDLEHHVMQTHRARQASLDRWAALDPQNRRAAFDATDCCEAGQQHLGHGAHHSALQSFRLARRLYEDALGPDNYFAVSLLVHISKLEAELGDLESARSTLTELARGWGALLGEDHPRYAEALNNLAVVQTARREYGEAERLLSAALGIYHPEREKHSLEYAKGLVNLAKVYNDRAEFESAALLAEQAIPLGHQNIHVPEVLLAAELQLVVSYGALGRLAEAEAACLRVLSVLSHLRKPDPYDIAQARLHHAAVLYAIGRVEEAEQLECPATKTLEDAGRPLPPVLELLGRRR